MVGRDTNRLSSSGLAGCSSLPNGGGRSGTKEKLEHKSHWSIVTTCVQTLVLEGNLLLPMRCL